MDIFFQDPSEVPLPPEDVRIRDFRVAPWSDGRRVHVYLEVDPFQKRPNAEVVILTQDLQISADISIIETMTRKMEFNMHLRPLEPTGLYQASVTLYYAPPAAEDEAAAAEHPGSAKRLVVDKAQVEFSVNKG